MVTSKKGTKEILSPNQSLQLSGKEVKKANEDNVENAVAWIDNNFIFTGVPLKVVFEELERQFDIQIKLSNVISDDYTGNFKRGSTPEEILEIICKPFGLSYRKTSANTYIISK